MQNIGFRQGRRRRQPDLAAGRLHDRTGRLRQGAPAALPAHRQPAVGDRLAGPGFFFLDPTGDAEHGLPPTLTVSPVTNVRRPRRRPRTAVRPRHAAPAGAASPVLPTSLAIHSNGYVVGVEPGLPTTCRSSSSPPAGMPDAQASVGQHPARAGHRPRAAFACTLQLTCIRPDQTILVLEARQPARSRPSVAGGTRSPRSLPAPRPRTGSRWSPMPRQREPAWSTCRSVSTSPATPIVLSQIGNGYDPLRLPPRRLCTPTGQHLRAPAGTRGRRPRRRSLAERLHAELPADRRSQAVAPSPR